MDSINYRTTEGLLRYSLDFEALVVKKLGNCMGDSNILDDIPDIIIEDAYKKAIIELSNNMSNFKL